MDERYPINAIHQAPNEFISSGSIPTELRDRPQWVAWKYGRLRGNGKQGKVPINPKSLKRADPTKPETWGTYEQALAAASSGGGLDGIGYVFSKDDPNLGTDTDGCRNPDTGDVHPAALEITEQLGGYWEVSPSGTGLHGIVQATKPGTCCSTTDTPWGGKIEIYDRDRFFTVTGEVFSDGKIEERQEAITGLYGRFFPEPGEDTAQAPARDVLGYGYPGTDAELVEAARHNQKTGAKFARLYDSGDPSGFPSRSEADRYLASRLAFWCGPDPERIERIMRESAMLRAKWNTHRTYLGRTIDHALREAGSFYDPEYRERKQQEVREIVEQVAEAVATEGWRKSDRAVWNRVLEVAKFGRCEDGVVRGFNLNQEQEEEDLGISRRSIGKSLKWLVDQGLIQKTRQGNKRAGNSAYVLKSSHYVGAPDAEDETSHYVGYTDAGTEVPTTYGHRGGESYVVEREQRPREAEEEKEEETKSPNSSEDSTTTGPEIEAEWKASDDHPLMCECITCSLPTPRYAKPHGEPGVGKLRKAA